MSTLKAFAKLVTSDTKEGLQRVHDFTVECDGKVRTELDAAISALKVDFGRLEALGRPYQPAPVPDLGKANERFEQLQQLVAESAGRLAESTEHLQAQLASSTGRLDALEHTSGLV